MTSGCVQVFFPQCPVPSVVTCKHSQLNVPWAFVVHYRACLLELTKMEDSLEGKL